jgi:lysophospholipase L1-like esterase
MSGSTRTSVRGHDVGRIRGLLAARFLLLSAALLAVFALATSVAASTAQEGGLYVAAGDSITAGLGASSLNWVQLYYGHLQGSGVTEFRNLGTPGITSTQFRNDQLARAVAAINASSDTKAVTLDIGINDIGLVTCPTANAPTCAVADNLRASLTALNAALATDPGDETLQVMEYYNWAVDTSNAAAQRQMLLGSDGKVDCTGAGADLGLNDLIHCISIEQHATPIDVLPVFDAAGAAFLASDHMHPNDAGHLAIANAFGGAATPTAPPAATPTAPPTATPPPTLAAGKPRLSKATAGQPLTAWMLVTNTRTGAGVKGQITCQGKLAGKSLRVSSHSSSSNGRSSCTWKLPVTGHNKQFQGTITSSFGGSAISRAFSTRVA